MPGGRGRRENRGAQGPAPPPPAVLPFVYQQDFYEAIAEVESDIEMTRELVTRFNKELNLSSTLKSDELIQSPRRHEVVGDATASGSGFVAKGGLDKKSEYIVEPSSALVSADKLKALTEAVVFNPMIQEKIFRHLRPCDLKSCTLVHSKWRNEAQLWMARAVVWNLYIRIRKDSSDSKKKGTSSSKPKYKPVEVLVGSNADVLEAYPLLEVIRALQLHEERKAAHAIATYPVNDFLKDFPLKWIRKLRMTIKAWDKEILCAYQLILKCLPNLTHLVMEIPMDGDCDPLLFFPKTVTGLNGLVDLSIDQTKYIEEKNIILQKNKSLPNPDEDELFGRIFALAPNLQVLGGTLLPPWPSTFTERLQKQIKEVHISLPKLDSHVALITLDFANLQTLGVNLQINGEVMTVILAKCAETLKVLKLYEMRFQMGPPTDAVGIPIMPNLKKMEIHGYCDPGMKRKKGMSPHIIFISETSAVSADEETDYAVQYPKLKSVVITTNLKGYQGHKFCIDALLNLARTERPLTSVTELDIDGALDAWKKDLETFSPTPEGIFMKLKAKQDRNSMLIKFCNVKNEFMDYLRQDFCKNEGR